MENQQSDNLQQPWRQSLQKNKTLMLMLDLMSVTSTHIVLPSVLHDVQYKMRELQWTITAYAIAYGAFLLTGGRLGDLFGHRRMFIFGVGWFALWTGVNGFAHNPVVMSLARALQGSGSGLTIPSAFAMITVSYPEGPERNNAVAILGGTAAVGSVIGIVFGGLLGSTIGWRWIYYIKALVALLILLLSLLVLPSHLNTSHATDRRIDYLGIVTFTYGVVAVIYYLSEGPIYGWFTPVTLAPFLGGLIFLAIFIVVESKIAYPVMPLRIFQSRRLVVSCIAILLNAAATSGMIYFAVLSFELALGYGPLKTAFSTLPLAMGAVIGIGIEMAIIDKVPTKLMTVVGWALLTISGIWWAQITTTSSFWAVAMPGLVLAGVGITACWICCQINVAADVADEDQGLVAAVFNVALQIGLALGCAVCNIVANNRNSQVLVHSGALVLPGYCDAFYACAGMAAMGLILTLLLAPNSDIRLDALEDDLLPTQDVYSGNPLAVLDDSDHGSILPAGSTRFGGFGEEKTELDQVGTNHCPTHDSGKQDL